MGLRGPAPKPAALRVLEGTTRRDRMRREPSPTRGAPACPKWLTPEARAVWRQIVPDLAAIGLLCRVDLGVLAVYCSALADYQAAAAVPRDVTDRSAVLAIAKIEGRILAAARELALSPAARARMGQLPDRERESDEIDDLLMRPARRGG